ARRSAPSAPPRVAAKRNVNSLIHDGQDVIFRQDQILLAVHGDLLAAVRAEEHAVALADLELGPLAVVEQLAVAAAQALALAGFLFGRVRQDDAAGGLFFRLQPPHDDLIIQGYDSHDSGLLAIERGSPRRPGDRTPAPAPAPLCRARRACSPA